VLWLLDGGGGENTYFIFKKVYCRHKINPPVPLWEGLGVAFTKFYFTATTSGR
jgi:hypothetical protein